jgi:hypothetical protein
MEKIFQLAPSSLVTVDEPPEDAGAGMSPLSSSSSAWSHDSGPTCSRDPTNLDPFPVLLVRMNSFDVDFSTPCRFIFTIPLELPSLIDPRIPPPACFPDDVRFNALRTHSYFSLAVDTIMKDSLQILLGSEALIEPQQLSEDNEPGRSDDPAMSLSSKETDQDTHKKTPPPLATGCDAPSFSGPRRREFPLINAFQYEIDHNISDPTLNPLVLDLSAASVLNGDMVVLTISRRRGTGTVEQEADLQTTPWPQSSAP